jgi:hypothetical protein
MSSSPARAAAARRRATESLHAGQMARIGDLTGSRLKYQIDTSDKELGVPYPL